MASQSDPASDPQRDELERQQPLGGINPRLLVGIAAVIILAAIVILIVVLTKT